MHTGTVERAFQLAPESRSIDEIRIKLRAEGYSSVDEHLAGLAIQTQLKRKLRK
jgi:hypothetical protein